MGESEKCLPEQQRFILVLLDWRALGSTSLRRSLYLSLYNCNFKRYKIDGFSQYECNPF